jgi:hypothetical protein
MTDADPVADLHHLADHLVAQCDQGRLSLQLAGGQLQIGATDPARVHVQPHLVRPERRRLPVHLAQRPAVDLSSATTQVSRAFTRVQPGFGMGAAVVVIDENVDGPGACGARSGVVQDGSFLSVTR